MKESAAQRWGEERERHWYHRLTHPQPKLEPVKEVPTLKEFAPRFLEAGLRCGEMMALEWSDVDLAKRQLCVKRSEWQQHVTAPKSGRLRYVPMTTRLAAGLQAHRHLRSPRVLCQRDGTSLTQDVVLDHVQRAARRAHLATSGVHRLRHTFCSHLAMRGAPARAIQELAGHRDLSTTQKYMHFSPAALDSAIRLLERPNPIGRGDMLETAEAKLLTP